MSPWTRLLLASAGLNFVLKTVALVIRRRRPAGAGLIMFLFAWPGVIPDWFEKRQGSRNMDAGRFLSAWARMGLAAAAILVLAIYAPDIPDEVLGIGGIAAFLGAIHLGIGDLLPSLLRSRGFQVPLLFERPWAARSLTEFWSRRWNLAFVEMNRFLFLRPAYRCFGSNGSRFALFAFSGALHEIGLSFPAGGGWGLPSAYFLLHGALVAVERRFRIANRAWTWFWLLAPSPWLFHQPFRSTLIVPLYRWLHELIASNSYQWYLSHALYAAAMGHLLVLIASFQVPSRLGWKEDIQKLRRFNQKIFWVYGMYIALSIVSFAVLTWTLHDSFLAGDPAARSLATFIAVFWTVRVLVDVLWYDHRDWPAGNAMIAGHALVTTLFCTLAAVYWLAAFGPLR